MKKREINIIMAAADDVTAKFCQAKTANEQGQLITLPLDCLLAVSRNFLDTAHLIFLLEVGFDQPPTVYRHKVVATFSEVEHRINGLMSHIEKLHGIHQDAHQMSQWMLTLLRRLGNLVGAIECLIDNVDSQAEESNDEIQEIDFYSDSLDDAFRDVNRKLMDAGNAAFRAQQLATEYLVRQNRTKPENVEELGRECRLPKPSSGAEMPSVSEYRLSPLGGIDNALALADTVTMSTNKAESIVSMLSHSFSEDGESMRPNDDTVYYALMTVKHELADIRSVVKAFCQAGQKNRQA